MLVKSGFPSESLICHLTQQKIEISNVGENGLEELFPQLYSLKGQLTFP